MAIYEKILVPIDLGEYSEDLIERALEVADSPASVHLAFVHQRMDSVYVGAGVIGSALAEVGGMEDRLQQDLRQRLAGWAEPYGIPPENAHFLNGKPSEQIQDFAMDNDVDLIVIATHSRKGLQRLLGSTAHSVLQGAPCDVLSVRAD